MNELVTLAIHIGKKENYSMMENLLKSILICNTYSELEIILIDSSGDNKIRDWFSKIDFDSNFINFDFSKTNIVKNKKVNIRKEIFFFNENHIYNKRSFTRCFNKAITIAKGKYFVYLTEDMQFIVRDDMISDYIGVLKTMGENKTIINLCTQQEYKYSKHNNRFGKPILLNKNNFIIFKPEEKKGDFFSFSSKEVHNSVGTLPEDSDEAPLAILTEYRKKCEELNIQRYYPGIFIGAWFSNKHHNFLNNKIKIETSKNPNFLLLKPLTKNELLNKFQKVLKERPISTEDLMMLNNWYFKISPINYLKKLLIAS